MIGEYDVRQAIRPLRFIFWGGLLCVLDVTLKSDGIKFDLLNDTLGAILITIGVTRLAAAPVDGRYRPVMGFVKGIAFLSIATTAVKHFDVSFLVLNGLLLIAGLLQLAATVGFCVAMRWFALEGGLARSARSWQLTTVLFVCIYALPLGLFYLAALSALATGGSFNVNLGPEALLLIVVMFVPLIHLFMSTSRMRKEAETGGQFPGRAFPVIPLDPPPAQGGDQGP